MSTTSLRRLIITGIFIFTGIISLTGKPADSAAPKEFRDITYLSINGQDLKLDVFKNSSSVISPVLVYYHGGGWTSNSRPKSWTGFKFYLSLGFSIVNVDYRLASDAKAPAAVQDCRAALSWVGSHAGEFGFDTKRIVVYGTSAGGHLAMMTGFVPAGAGFDLPQSESMPRTAAIIDFYGIADVNDLLSGTNKRGWANTWIGTGKDREALAKIMSPLGYITGTSPPIIIIHGDSDPTVPYEHALKISKLCEVNGVKHKLITVKNGKHGNFSKENTIIIEKDISGFLKETGILK